MPTEETLIYFNFDLQLFADGDTGEKTEPATPRRREDARKKGQVFKSTDLNSAIVLLAGSGAIFASLPFAFNEIKKLLVIFFTDYALRDMNHEYAYYLLLESIVYFAKITGPVLIAAFIGALLISYMQVGFVFTTEPLTPKFNRINPIEGFKRIFSKRALVELIKSLLKVTITGYIVYTVLSKYFYVFPRMLDMELMSCIMMFGEIVFEIALKVGLVFVIVGVLDFIYQWYEYEVSLRMSKYEVKQEYKQNEGDPLIKSRQKHIQREMAMKRMMAEVPKADVVITNPTHFAIALRYKADSMSAPQVIAKGQDHIALRIKEIAKDNKIVVVENPALARTLYAICEIGTVIPEDLYQAVAEVLAFVYQQKNSSFNRGE